MGRDHRLIHVHYVRCLRPYQGALNQCILCVSRLRQGEREWPEGSKPCGIDFPCPTVESFDDHHGLALTYSTLQPTIRILRSRILCPVPASHAPREALDLPLSGQHFERAPPSVCCSSPPRLSIRPYATAPQNLARPVQWASQDRNNRLTKSHHLDAHHIQPR